MLKFTLSKGDIFVEPLEFLIQILSRIFGKVIGQNFLNEPVEHWGKTQALWIAIFVGIIALAIWIKNQPKKKVFEKITALLKYIPIKYIPSTALFLIGLASFASTRTIDLPSEEKLTKITGNLLSVESVPDGKHSLRMIKIEGQNNLFVYSSADPLCGNVYDKLLEKQGESISIKFDGQDLVKSPNLPNYFNVYDIWSDNIPICTYWDILEMNETEDKIGTYLGIGLMILSISIFIGIPRKQT